MSKDINLYPFSLLGESIHCELKMDKQVCTLEKVDDKIPVDPGAKRRQNQNMNRERYFQN